MNKPRVASLHIPCQYTGIIQVVTSNVEQGDTSEGVNQRFNLGVLFLVELLGSSMIKLANLISYSSFVGTASATDGCARGELVDLDCSLAEVVMHTFGYRETGGAFNLTSV